MVNTNLNKFLMEVNYNSEKMTVTTDGIEVNLNWEEDMTRSSYLDNDYYALTGEYLIMITGADRPCKELMFDFYHEVGHIKLDKGIIDTEMTERWLKRHRDFVPSDPDYIMTEMTCDAHAISKLGFTGNVTKLLPLAKRPFILRNHPTASEEKIKEYIAEVNKDICIRRRYLEYLISENAIMGYPKTSIKLTKVEDNYAKSCDKRMTLSRAKVVVKELAESVGIDTRSKSEIASSRQTPMMVILRKMHITYSTGATFDELCSRLITAITSPSVRMSMFNIVPYRYDKVDYKPDNWDTEYTNYFRFDEGIGRYVKYTSTPSKKVTAKPTVDEVTGDVIVSEEETTENTAQEEAKQDTPKVPEWNANVYQKVIINVTDEARKIRSKYGRIVREFIIPYFNKYQQSVNSSERNVLIHVIETLLDRYTISQLNYPTQYDVEEIRRTYNNTEDHIAKVKSMSAGMLSYKDKLDIAKQNNPRRPDESNSEYDERMNALVRDNKYNTKSA